MRRAQSSNSQNCRSSTAGEISHLLNSDNVLEIHTQHTRMHAHTHTPFLEASVTFMEEERKICLHRMIDFFKIWNNWDRKNLKRPFWWEAISVNRLCSWCKLIGIKWIEGWQQKLLFIEGYFGQMCKQGHTAMSQSLLHGVHQGIKQTLPCWLSSQAVSKLTDLFIANAFLFNLLTGLQSKGLIQ